MVAHSCNPSTPKAEARKIPPSSRPTWATWRLGDPFTGGSRESVGGHLCSESCGLPREHVSESMESKPHPLSVRPLLHVDLRIGRDYFIALTLQKHL